jgi:soluble lytic murein transglycosylase
MTGSVGVAGDVLALAIRGEEPAGRRKAASRRRSLALALGFAVCAAGGGAALGLLAQPGPEKDQFENLAFTTAAAVNAARRSETRAKVTEKALAEAKARIDVLTAAGAVQELADYQEADHLGVSRFMKDSPALSGDERRHVMAAIVRESRRNGLDPVLVAAVIQVESHFDPFAVSGVGAYGLMQLMPPTAQWLMEKGSETTALRPARLFNPILNIELGTMYLAQLMNRFDGDLTQALIGYNAGPGVARSLRRGSKAWRRLVQYPKAVLTAYRTLLTPPQQLAAR